MKIESKIEWTDYTINPWWGCAKVHTGCKNCYAEYLSETRYKNGVWGENAPRRAIKSAFLDLDKIQKKAAKQGVKFRVFIGSMMDIFEDSKPLLNPTETEKETGDLRNKLFNGITEGKYPNIVFLFLTKRPENIFGVVPHEWKGENCPPKNIWFGTSISNQETANLLIPKLLRYKPSNLFISLEPQVGEVSYRWATWHDYKDKSNGTPIIHNGEPHISFGQYDGIKGIGWVIQGGESGSKKRPFNLEWARSMRDQCKIAGIPYFFKQIDKIQEIPEDLMIREFPNF